MCVERQTGKQTKKGRKKWPIVVGVVLVFVVGFAVGGPACGVVFAGVVLCVAGLPQ